MRPISRVYVSGPMTGLPDFNFPAFDAAALGLRAIGVGVENPAELKLDPQAASRHEYLRADLNALAGCDAMALLPGWERSPGSRLEIENALAMGLVIAPLGAFLIDSGA